MPELEELYKNAKNDVGDGIISFEMFSNKYNNNPKYRADVLDKYSPVKKKVFSEELTSEQIPSQSVRILDNLSNSASSSEASSSESQDLTGTGSSESPTERPPFKYDPEQEFSVEQLRRGEDYFNKLLENPFPINKVPFKEKEDVTGYTNLDEEHYQNDLSTIESSSKSIKELEQKWGNILNVDAVHRRDLSGDHLKGVQEIDKHKRQLSDAQFRVDNINFKRQSAQNLSLLNNKYPEAYDEVALNYGYVKTINSNDDASVSQWLTRVGTGAAKILNPYASSDATIRETAKDRVVKAYSESTLKGLEDTKINIIESENQLTSDYTAAEFHVKAIEQRYAKEQINEESAKAQIDQIKNSINLRLDNLKQEKEKFSLYKETMSMLVNQANTENQSELETFAKSYSNELVKLPRQAASLALLVTHPDISEGQTFTNAMLDVYDEMSEITEDMTLGVDNRHRMSALTGQIFGQLTEIVGLAAINPLAAKLFTVAMTHDEAYGFLRDETKLTHHEANRMASVYAAIAAPMEYAGARIGIENFGKKILKDMALNSMKSGKLMSKEAIKKQVIGSAKHLATSMSVEGLEEGITEGSQFAVLEKIKENKDFFGGSADVPTLNPNEYWEQLTENVWGGAYAGVLMGGAGSLNVATRSNMSNTENMLLDNNSFESMKVMAKSRLELGKMTKQEYDLTIKNMNNSRRAFKDATGVYNQSDKRKALQLSLNRSEVNELPDTDITKAAKLSKINEQLKVIGENNSTLTPSMRAATTYMKTKYKGFEKMIDLSQSGETQDIVEDKEGEKTTKNTVAYQKAVNRAKKDIDTEINKLQGKKGSEQTLKSLYEIKRDLEATEGQMFISTPTSSAIKMDKKTESISKSTSEAINVLRGIASSGRDNLTAKDVKEIKSTLQKNGVDPNTVRGMNNLEGLAVRDAIGMFRGNQKTLKTMSKQNRQFIEAQEVAKNTGVESTIVNQIAGMYDKLGYSPSESKNLTAMTTRLVAAISGKTGKSKQEVLKKIDVVGEQKRVTDAATGLEPIAKLAEIYSEFLSDKEKADIASSFSTKDNKLNWGKKVKARFIDGFVKSITLGDTYVDELKKPYRELQTFVKDMVGQSDNKNYGINLTKEAKDVYASMVGDYTRSQRISNEKSRSELIENADAIESMRGILEDRVEQNDKKEYSYNYLDEGKVMDIRNKVVAQSDKVAKSLSKSLKRKIDVVIFETTEAYERATGKTGKGYFDGEFIYINLSKANTRTAAHEAFHALVAENVFNGEIYSKPQLAAITKSMYDSVYRSIVKSKDKDKLEKLLEAKKFVKENYDDSEVFDEEILAEYLGMMAEEVKSFDVSTKNKIKLWVNSVSKSLGLGNIFTSEEISDAELADFLNKMSRRLSDGKRFKDIDLTELMVGQGKSKPNIIGDILTSSREQKDVTRLGMLLNTPSQRAAILSSQTIESNNDKQALQLANIDVVRLFPRFKNKISRDIRKVLEDYLATGNPELLGATASNSDETGISSMDKYLAYDNVMKARLGDMESHNRTLGLPFDWAKGTTRWYMGLFGDTMTILRNELSHLSTEDYLTVVESTGLFKYLNGSGMSATDIELANDDRRAINRFLKRNKLLNDDVSTQEFMGRTSFLAMFLSPTTETHTDLEGWLDTVINNIDVHVKSLKYRISKSNKNKDVVKESEASIAGALAAQSYLKEIQDKYEGTVDSNMEDIMIDMIDEFPIEMELIGKTSGMHRIHRDVIFNYKKKIGDSDLYEAFLYNHRSYRTAGESLVEVTDENDNYARMMSTTSSLEDRKQSKMNKNQYLVTNSFVDLQQRSYNMSSRVAYTGAAIRQMDYATKTGEFQSIIGDEAGVKAIRTKLRSMVNYSVVADMLTLDSSGAGMVKSTWSRFNTFKNQNLITLKQPFVQLSVLAHTAILAGGHYAKVVGELSSQDNVDAMMTLLTNESSLGARSVSYMIGSATSAKQDLTSIMLGNATSWISKNLLNNPDYLAATSSWLAFYRKKRTEQLGSDEDFSWAEEAKNPNRNALNYAEFMQQSSQASNVKEAGSSFSTQKNEWWGMTRETIFPFAFFNNSFMTNLMIDFKMSGHDADARKRMVGYSAIPVAYAGVKWGFKIALLNSAIAMIANLVDDDEDKEKTAVELYGTMATSAMEESKSKFQSWKGLGNMVATQFISDFILAGVFVDEIKRPIMNNVVNLIDYSFGNADISQEDKLGEEYFVKIANDLLYETYGEFLDSDGKILDVYDGKKNWDYIAPSFVMFAKGIGAFYAANQGEIELEGETVRLSQREIDILLIVGATDIISAIFPLQELKQIENKSRRVNEQILKGTRFGELANKGLLNSKTNIELFKDWETEYFFKSPPQTFDSRMNKLLMKDLHIYNTAVDNRKLYNLRVEDVNMIKSINSSLFRDGQKILYDEDRYSQLREIEEILDEAASNKK